MPLARPSRESTRDAQRQIDGLERGLARLKARAQAPTRALRDRDKANRRLGHLFQKYSGAARLYDVQVRELADNDRKTGTRLSAEVTIRQNPRAWVEQADGRCLLRTNLKGRDARDLWKTYIGLTRIEDCFRVAKHDLGLRPIFHRREDRTQAHILVCFLSLVPRRTLEQWMEASGLGTAPRKLLEELAEVRSMDVVLPTRAGPEIRPRTVSRPEKHLAILLDRLDLPLPNKPKRVRNVVKTFAEKRRVPSEMGNSSLRTADDGLASRRSVRQQAVFPRRARRRNSCIWPVLGHGRRARERSHPRRGTADGRFGGIASNPRQKVRKRVSRIRKQKAGNAGLL